MGWGQASTPAPSAKAARFEEWLTEGLAQGWCSEPHCSSHNGTFLTEGEQADERGGEDVLDRCMTVVRVWGPDGPPD